MTRALIFALTEHLVTDVSRSLEHCHARGYDMRGVVCDDWRTAVAYLLAGTADILVIADENHLDPDRVPRIEVVAHSRLVRPGSTARERTRLIRRDAAR